jgi:hypothetical protein
MAPSWLEKFIVREDATPDPRRNTELPAFEINYTADEDHRRVLAVKGEKSPRYEVTREAILGAWGDKLTVKSPSDAGKTIAVIDFRSVPPRIEISFPQRQHDIYIKTTKPQYDSSGGLGRLHWKGTGMKLISSGSWELRDKVELILSVTIDGDQENGTISLWRGGLDDQTIEELVIVGISQIEDYKKTLRKSGIALGTVILT